MFFEPIVIEYKIYILLLKVTKKVFTVEWKEMPQTLQLKVIDKAIRIVKKTTN